MASENNGRTHIENWHVNCSKGMIDALVEIGRDIEHMYGDENRSLDGGIEALIDYIDDKIGSLENLSIPAEYKKYTMQEGKVNGYMNTLLLLRSLARLKGI